MANPQWQSLSNSEFLCQSRPWVQPVNLGKSMECNSNQNATPMFKPYEIDYGNLSKVRPTLSFESMATFHLHLG
jgi:hypothetical protein